MVTLQEIQKSINIMPQNASVDDVIERIIYLQKIDDALEEVEKGNYYTNEEVKQHMQQWLKK